MMGVWIATPSARNDERKGREVRNRPLDGVLHRGVTKEWVRWNRPLDGVIHRGVTRERGRHDERWGMDRV